MGVSYMHTKIRWLGYCLFGFKTSVSVSCKPYGVSSVCSMLSVSKKIHLLSHKACIYVQLLLNKWAVDIISLWSFSKDAKVLSHVGNAGAIHLFTWIFFF